MTIPSTDHTCNCINFLILQLIDTLVFYSTARFLHQSQKSRSKVDFLLYSMIPAPRSRSKVDFRLYSTIPAPITQGLTLESRPEGDVALNTVLIFPNGTVQQEFLFPNHTKTQCLALKQGEGYSQTSRLLPLAYSSRSTKL